MEEMIPTINQLTTRGTDKCIQMAVMLKISKSLILELTSPQKFGEI